ncbi:dihydroxyacetone kinase family protein [Amnibacterium sp. CER49]|uniref:dihydroxyacetone kinase family protein n=1 Tax=Amnibacterium sp. CER49 TaxID=3039161 RepID=UPI00244818F6|nr:dihydroxyacetone kinase family protein [Amnibacterium sp. CER49]MDH2444672.1 dihydroxyacetone kinase family protein [Amnibacterium sp. CER49]
MSYLRNDPTRFTDELTAGFVRANGDLVRRVEGGVARRTRTPETQVAVVIGGGSGHYPAFAGLVGPGLAHGAAMGNVFASPSAHQVYSVAKAVATPAGVLLSYGNYAGDVLNFDQAQERLNAEGIPCRTVRVTDDVFSAGEDEREKRRGIAGDLVVFRVAAWAAEQGRSLEEVEALAARANDRTVSLGVAFSGCTLPGAEEPLFTVPAGRMAVGMGIHGEPGIDEVDLPTAEELAHLFVDRLLAERPDGADRVAVILNGLGSVKTEELFVAYTTIADLLEGAGLTIVEPEVGEYATSFEMAGASLTLTWLDEELEQAWRSPAYTPAYRKGAGGLDLAAGEQVDEEAAAEEAAAEEIPPASDDSRRAVGRVVRAITAIRETIDREADALGRLDAVAGDGDHGIGMQRGATAADAAARDAADRGAGAGTTLALAGDAWADKAGGTSGALWGAALRALGTSLGDDAAPSAERVAEAVAAARDAVTRFGKAEVGDKTLVDALVPFTDSLAAHVGNGEALAVAWRAAAADATAAAEATADLLPRLGRARPHVEKSRGTPDPGAVSLAQTLTAVTAVLAEGGDE